MSDVDAASTDPATAVSDGYRFEIDGGHPALDFANTISRRTDPANNRERLTHYGRLVSWGVQAGIVTAREAERLRARASGQRRAAAAAWRRAIVVREAIFGLFAAIARGERAPAATLDTLNAALPLALASLRLGTERDGFGWRFTHDETDLAPMLAPVVRGAAELLTSADRARVRECGSDTCRWLFIDRSKNGTRRWCDMKVCGNRAKARRHYQRERRTAKATRSAAPRGKA